MIEWINGALSALVGAMSVGNPLGLAAILLLTVSADIGIPVPFALDTILFFTSYEAGPFSLPVLLIVMMLLSGRLVGTSIIYWLGRIFGTKIVGRLGRHSQWLRRNLEQFQNKLNGRPTLAIVVARLTPGLMQVSSVAAGTLRIRYYVLVVAILLSSIVYDGTLIIIGSLTRLGLKGLEPKYAAWVVLGFVALMIVAFVTIHLVRRRLEQG